MAPTLSSNLVDQTLRQHCDKLPAWMLLEDGSSVYMGAGATLFAAVVASTGYAAWTLLGGLTYKTLRAALKWLRAAFFKKCIGVEAAQKAGVAVVLRLVRMIHQLPASAQVKVGGVLQIAGIPAIGQPEFLLTNDAAKDDGGTRPAATAASGGVVDLDEDAERNGSFKDGVDEELGQVELAPSRCPLSSADEPPLTAPPLPPPPPVGTRLDGPIDAGGEGAKRLFSPSTAWVTWSESSDSRFANVPKGFADLYLSLDKLRGEILDRESWACVEAFLRLYAKKNMPPILEALPPPLSKATALSPFREVASRDFCAWMSLHGSAEKFTATLLASDIEGMLSEAHEASDREDGATLLLLQLLVGLVVLSEFFVVLEKPTGTSWLCIWTYATSVVVFKPFTVPMWYLLLACCHYTFADLLYGADPKRGRNGSSGTPLGAPFERNKFTLAMVCTVMVLQGMWCLVALPVALPLFLVFFPAVVLAAFVLPFVCAMLAQKTLGPLAKWWRLQFRDTLMEALKKDGMALGWVLSRALREDKKVVLAAVKQNGLALQFTSKQLREDEEMQLVAVKHGGMALQYASKRLRGDKDVVVGAVRQNGWALQYASVELRDNMDVAAEAILGCNWDRKVLQFTSEGEGLSNQDGFNNVWRQKHREREKRLAARPEEGEEDAPAFAPLQFDLSLFVLKAAATQLVSIVVLMLALLPFFTHGFSWWTSGASRFLVQSFDLGDLALQVRFSFFGWPSFPEPRLGWQLAAGVFLLALQLLFRVVKWALRHGHPLLRLRTAAPGPLERSMVRALAWCSWKPFGAAMDVGTAAVEATMEEWKRAPEKLSKAMEEQEWWSRTKKVSWVLGYYGLFVPFALPPYLAYTSGRHKTFDSEATDLMVLDFCGAEASMGYRQITIKGTQAITALSLRSISQQCLWLEHLDLSGCTGVAADMEVVAVLVSLRVLNCAGCGVLYGNVRVFALQIRLKVLNLSRTKVEGKVEGLAPLVLLEELYLERTKVEGKVEGLAPLVRLKELNLSGTKVEGNLDDLKKAQGR